MYGLTIRLYGDIMIYETEPEDCPIALTIEFQYTRQSPDIFDKGHGNYLPGDPPNIKLEHVWVGSSNGRVDVLKNISGADIYKLECMCLEYAQELGE